MLIDKMECADWHALIRCSLFQPVPSILYGGGGGGSFRRGPLIYEKGPGGPNLMGPVYFMTLAVCFEIFSYYNGDTRQKRQDFEKE